MIKYYIVNTLYTRYACAHCARGAAAVCFIAASLKKVNYEIL